MTPECLLWASNVEGTRYSNEVAGGSNFESLPSSLIIRKLDTAGLHMCNNVNVSSVTNKQITSNIISFP